MLRTTRLYLPGVYEIEIFSTFKFIYKILTLEHYIHNLTLPIHHK